MRANPQLFKSVPGDVWQAAEAELGVKFGLQALGRGDDGLIYPVTDAPGEMVVKFTVADWEATLTDIVLRGQVWPARPTNTYRVLFPAVVRALVIHDAKRKWYVTLREDVDPAWHKADEVASESAADDRRHKWAMRIFKTLEHLYHASESITRSGDYRGEQSDELFEVGMNFVDQAETESPREMEGVREAILSLRERGFLLWDMHEGNWGLRKLDLPKFPPPGRFVALDWGRSAIREPALEAKARELGRFKHVTLNPSGDPGPFALWTRIRA